MSDLLNEAGIKFLSHDLDNIMDEKTFDRFNVGLSGRGAKLFEENPVIKQHVERLYACYPDIDFHAKIAS